MAATQSGVMATPIFLVIWCLSVNFWALQYGVSASQLCPPDTGVSGTVCANLPSVSAIACAQPPTDCGALGPLNSVILTQIGGASFPLGEADTTGATDAAGCCRACQINPDCVAWNYIVNFGAFGVSGCYLITSESCSTDVVKAGVTFVGGDLGLGYHGSGGKCKDDCSPGLCTATTGAKGVCNKNCGKGMSGCNCFDVQVVNKQCVPCKDNVKGTPPNQNCVANGQKAGSNYAPDGTTYCDAADPSKACAIDTSCNNAGGSKCGSPGMKCCHF